MIFDRGAIFSGGVEPRPSAPGAPGPRGDFDLLLDRRLRDAEITLEQAP